MSTDDTGKSFDADEIMAALAKAPERTLGEVKSGLTGEAPGAAPARVALTQGSHAGRFVIEARLGAGGMGVVFSAKDPELDRRVAIKLLHPGRGQMEQETRILAEARALAALSHPNVVTVFEVGTCEAGLFIAMELVEGTTLRQWLLAERRPWREVLNAFVEAGRGLAAAHAAGIVHRDFKPENVLVGNDGRVRVTDFGLAQSESAPTEPGVRVGTPRYMSPEQRKGENADARADQYAFCVALAEALHPDDPIKEKVPLGRVPKVIDRLIAQGRADSREARHTSVEALLQSIERALARRRQLATGALLTLSALVVAGLALVFGREKPCAGFERSLDGAWDPIHRAKAQAAFQQTNPQMGPSMWARVEQVIDAAAQELITAQVQACEATRVRGEQSEALLDRRMACLATRRERLASLVDIFQTAPVDLTRALNASRELPGVQVCSDPQLLLLGTPVPPSKEIDAKLKPGRDHVARAMTLIDLARYKESLEESGKGLAIATELHDGPLKAEALLASGCAHSELRETKEAVADLQASALEGEATRHDLVVAKARVRLVHVVGFQLADKGIRTREVPEADAALRRMNDPPDDRARFLSNYASAELVLDDRKHAEALRREGLKFAETHLSPASPVMFTLRNGLANDLKGAGRFDEAREIYQQLVAQQEKAYGPEHPLVATTLMGLGSTYRAVGKLDEALAAQGRALKIREQVFGPENPDVAAVLNNMANIYLDMGHFDQGIEALKRAVHIYENGGLRSHPYLALTEVNLGSALMVTGRFPEALQHHKRSLELLLERGDKDTFDVGKAHLEMACDLTMMGKPEESRAEYEEAMRIITLKRGVGNPEYVDAQSQYAGALVESGHHKEALALNREALAGRIKLLGDKNPLLMQSYLGIAQSLLALGDAKAALVEIDKAVPLTEAAAGGTIDQANTMSIRAKILAKLGRHADSVDEARATIKVLEPLKADGEKLRKEMEELITAQSKM
ncbi:MAG: serine/threonine protein kinase [Deltaproteobacteria bacterium]|nr:serine/threonine protein kinase [Deltaproteobacteria bacterium]